MDDYDDYTRQVETAVSIERGAWEAVVADIVKANVERVRELQAQLSAAEGRVRYLEGVCKDAKIAVYKRVGTSAFYRREE